MQRRRPGQVGGHIPRSPYELCGYPVEYAWRKDDLATVEQVA